MYHTAGTNISRIRSNQLIIYQKEKV